MSKQSRKRKHRIANEHAPSKVMFTLEDVKILKKSLHLVDDVIVRSNASLPNLNLALEITLSLKIKLRDMLEREEWEKETPFDSNEIHILYTSVHMYLIELKFTQQHSLISPCIALCKQFSLIVEHVDREAKRQP